MSSTKFEIIDTRITDHWGVEWNAMEIVRDFLQNFYDANPVNTIKIKIKNRTVIVSAPAEFDYKSLLYLGSDKGTSDIGQYGEGFKASMLNAMRDHGCIVQVHINDCLLEFFFHNEKIGETEKKIIKCKKSQVSKVRGTHLILKNCSKGIIDEFKFGLNYFYYENNPLFDELLTRHYSNDILIFKSSSKNIGYVFYKKLLRAKLDIPIIIVCNRKYKSIDAKIKHDRDRKAFDDKVLESLLKYIFKNINIASIVEILKPFWSEGHKILRIMGSRRYGRRRMIFKFPENYYAKQIQLRVMNPVMKMQVKKMEQEFQEKNYIQCPGYMHNLGMKNAHLVIQKRIEEKKRKRKTLYTRRPTELEGSALNVLKNYIHDIDPLLANRFSYAQYTIGDTEELVGELKLGRVFRVKEVYLSQSFFTFKFNIALSVLLHEWGHIYGFDGSRGFTDALTEILSIIIEQRNELNDVEIKWNKISLKIANKQIKTESPHKIHLILDKLTNKQKIQLLKSLPEDELLKLIEKENIKVPIT